MFKDKVAFITGGGSGIGAATARRFAAGGAFVVVVDVVADNARRVAEEAEGMALECDVTDTGMVRAAVAAAEDAAGPIDVLVNNAGAGGFAMFVDTDERDWDRILGVNLRGVIACSHAVVPGMLERRRGAIVNVASEAGRVGTVAGAIYAAAKAGVIGLTKALARETAPYGIRCNAVAPGPIDTPLLNDTAAESTLGTRAKQGMVDATLFKRLGTPDEVAGAIAFLASEDASFITGHTLAVSGGVSMT